MKNILIAGVDEVGRGAWAGPIVAAAVILGDPIDGLKDSKLLSRHKRQSLDMIIKEHAICWAIARVESYEIDEMGIGEANKLVMRLALDRLSNEPNLVRIDGFSCESKFVEEIYVKGDSLYPEISAASIIAKVYRDNLMHELHQLDSRYAFNKHVGYGTILHRERLHTHGPSNYHRYSFSPIKNLI